MDLVSVMERFPDQESCIEHLEGIRWGEKPRCPKCEGSNLVRKNESGLGRIGRWHCSDCGSIVQSYQWHTFSRNEDTTSEVVFGYLTGSQRKERFIILSTCKRCGGETKGCMVYNDEDTCRDVKELFGIRGNCRG